MAGPNGYPLYKQVPKSNRFRGITLGHLDNFEGGQYESINLTSALFEGRDDSSDAVYMECWSAPGLSKPTFQEATRQKYEPITKGHEFGPSWSNHWVRMTINIKKEWQKKERVQLEFDPGCEAMIFTTEGLPLQGITGAFNGDRRVEFIIPEKERKYAFKVYIEVSANGMFGISQDGNVDPNRYFRLDSADIVVPRMEAWHLLWDFRIIKDITRNTPTNQPLSLKAQSVAMEIMNTFKYDDLSTISKCREIAEKVFGKGWQAKGAGIYCEETGEWDGKGGMGVPILGVGNCHIDTAWLWPFSATQQKSARSWSTQIDLMERYPEYRFTTSQAQQFKWLEKLYPSLFARVKAKVEEGKFLPIGGACFRLFSLLSWVEHDTNMPCGEALCRQFSFGQRYFKSRFGEYCSVFWLPDSFGYSSQIPQLSRLAGMPYFFTQKLSWSQFNGFPHNSFNWIGIDGTQMLVHMTPVDTYTAQASVADCIKCVANNKDLEWSQKGLLTYGNGDGGGGPLPPMLEGLRRIRAAANESPALPKVTQGRSVPEFFNDLLKTTNHGEDLPSWRGELYLEYHRGTYTSHGSIKRHNRKCEILLREIEYAATLASLAGPRKAGATAYEYPKDELDALWEDVLLCQFHDVLPGSAIAMVYEDAERIYANVERKGAALLEQALRSLLPHSRAMGSARKAGEDISLVGLNTLSFGRQEITKIPVASYDGFSAFSPSEWDQDSGYVCLRDDSGNGTVAPVPHSSFDSDVQLARALTSMDEEGNAFYILANAYLEVHISKDGRITSIVDTELERELLASPAGFVTFQDQPLNFEAWDIDIFHLDTREEVKATTISVAEQGGLRAALLLEYKFGESGDSKISTLVSLDAIAATTKVDALSMLRFDTQVDWHERRRLLKFEVPLDINADQATYEIQYGTLSRPTHQNTSWDRAKFEVCAHKFADVSEFGYGVALLNDCKYGYSCIGNQLRLTLIKGACAPDPNQDQGKHQFSFAILPHRGSFLESDVPQAAMAFNNPMHLRQVAARKPTSSESSRTPKATLTDCQAPFELKGAKNVFIDAVKRGDDDTFGFHSRTHTKSVVVRLYEAFGGVGKADLITTLPIRDAQIVDILERFQDAVEMVSLPEVNGQSKTLLKLKMKPFQVLTLRLIVE